jgi:uncharacterized membrane protein YgcG
MVRMTEDEARALQRELRVALQSGAEADGIRKALDTLDAVIARQAMVDTRKAEAKQDNVIRKDGCLLPLTMLAAILLFPIGVQAAMVAGKAVVSWIR